MDLAREATQHFCLMNRPLLLMNALHKKYEKSAINMLQQHYSKSIGKPTGAILIPKKQHQLARKVRIEKGTSCALGK